MDLTPKQQDYATRFYNCFLAKYGFAWGPFCETSKQFYEYSSLQDIFQTLLSKSLKDFNKMYIDENFAISLTVKSILFKANVCISFLLEPRHKKTGLRE